MNKLCRSLSAISVLLGASAMLAGCGEEPSDVVDSVASLSFTGVPLYDPGTVCRVGGSVMHCCPYDYVMIGAQVDDNIFKCARLSGMLQGRYLDDKTVRNGMRACPYGSVMVGLHVARNLLACQAPVTGVKSEYVDGNPPTNDGYPMHVCHGSNYAMSGIHRSDNLFTCAR